MKHGTQSRSQVVIGFVQTFLLKHRVSKTAFADDVKNIYHERTAVTDRTIEFHEDKDAVKDMKLNAQLLFRMLEADQHDVRLAAALSAPRMPMAYQIGRNQVNQYYVACPPVPKRRSGAAEIKRRSRKEKNKKQRKKRKGKRWR